MGRAWNSQHFSVWLGREWRTCRYSSRDLNPRSLLSGGFSIDRLSNDSGVAIDCAVHCIGRREVREVLAGLAGRCDFYAIAPGKLAPGSKNNLALEAEFAILLMRDFLWAT